MHRSTCLFVLALTACAAPPPQAGPRRTYTEDEELVLNGYLPPITPALDGAVTLAVVHGHVDDAKTQLGALCGRGDAEACALAVWVEAGAHDAPEGVTADLTRIWQKAEPTIRYCGNSWDAYGKVTLHAVIDPHGDSLAVTTETEPTIPAQVAQCVVRQARMVTHVRHDEALGLVKTTYTFTIMREITHSALAPGVVEQVEAYLFADDEDASRLGRAALNRECDNGGHEACSIVGWLEHFERKAPAVAIADLHISDADLATQRLEFKRCSRYVRGSSYTEIEVYIDPHGHVVASRSIHTQRYRESVSRCFANLFRDFAFPPHDVALGIIRVHMPITVDIDDDDGPSTL